MSSDPEQKAGDVLSLHDGKMVKTIITPGIGQRSPPAGSKVFVHYVGTLQATGEKFDSSRDRGDPFSFTIGSGQVIKGWDVGVGYMRKNEKSMLTLHSDFAYGDRGSPPKIPGGATLCFEVELLDWEKDASPVTEDKGVMKTTAQESAEPMSSRPQRYATCTFSMEVRENDEDGKTVQKEQEYVLDLDDTATATSSIAGLWGVQEAVRSMKKGEIAEFTVEPDYGTGQDGALAEKLGLPLGGRLRLYLKITLQSYTDVEGFPKEHHEWATQSTAFKLAHAQRLKATGNFFYAKQKQFGRALAYYKEALDLYFDEEESSGEENKEITKLQTGLHNNSSLMYFKVKDYANSEGSADEVLSLDPENVKALVRKAQIIASRPAGDVEVAFNLCKRAVEADPNHKDAKKWFAALQKKWRKEVAKQKKMYAGMFDKVSLVSDAEVAAAKAKPQPNPSFDTSEDEEEVEGKGL